MQIDRWELLPLVQEYITKYYAAALISRDKLPQLKSYISQYLYDNGYTMEDVFQSTLTDWLYNEMAGYSFLSDLLTNPELEEININAWNDVSLSYSDGIVLKSKEHFHNPQHAVDIVKRLLHHSGMVIDNAAPFVQGFLPNNTRITALKTPIVDEDCGISASIRILHPQTIDRTELIQNETATTDILDFLCLCLRYGVSMVIAGATNSGKTTLLNILLQSVPPEKRVFTIESGARELSLVQHDKYGNVQNNVVHTLSRPSDNSAFDISQEDLVIASLRFTPDVIVVGEMRDSEAYAAVEASLTGHTVISTVHSGAGQAAHTRIALLTQKRFPIDFNISLYQVGQAFPLIIHTRKLEDNSRKILDISECEITPDNKETYRTLYRYHITKNEIRNDIYQIEGHFEKVNSISDNLKERLIQAGAPQSALKNL